MQDRYAADLGDFLKFGLLRQLAAPVDGTGPLRLGVVWYLVPDEGHNDDGKHVTNLAPGSKAGAQLRPLDPDLFGRLAHVAETERSIASLEAVQVLPAETLFFNDRLRLAAAGDQP